jgi:hypothetical protein
VAVKMAKLTKRGFSAWLFDAMEFGYKACERGENIQMAREKIAPFINTMADSCDNLPKEILRIEFPKPGGRRKRARITKALR